MNFNLTAVEESVRMETKFYLFSALFLSALVLVCLQGGPLAAFWQKFAIFHPGYKECLNSLRRLQWVTQQRKERGDQV